MRCPVCKQILSLSRIGIMAHYRAKHPEAPLPNPNWKGGPPRIRTHPIGILSRSD